MRLSVRLDDSGFRSFSGIHKIFCNGEDITKHCHTADEEEGKAWVYVVGPQGEYILNPETGHAIDTVLMGKINIFLPVNGI